MLTLKINPADLIKVNVLLSGITNGAATALSRGINKAIDGASPDIKAKVGPDVNYKAGEISKQIKGFKSAPNRLKANIVVSEGAYGRGLGTPFSALKNVNQTKQGVSLVIKKDRGRKLLKTAFIAKMKSGHEGVFIRTGKTNLRYANDRGDLRGAMKPKEDRKENIKEVFTTSVNDALSNKKSMDQVMEALQGRMDKELDRQVDLLLSKL